jgi:hypothetical protein
VGQREHQRHVGAGDDGQPLRADELGQVVAHRADEHELGPPRPRRAADDRAPGCRVRARPGLTIVFLSGMPPKHTNSSVWRSMTDHAVARSRNRRASSHDVRHDHGQRAVAVGVLAADEPPRQFRKRWSWLCAWWNGPRCSSRTSRRRQPAPPCRVVDATELAASTSTAISSSPERKVLPRVAHPGRATVEPAGSHHGLNDARRMSEAPDDVAEKR